jgi:hypothetical protein
MFSIKSRYFTHSCYKNPTSTLPAITTIYTQTPKHPLKPIKIQGLLKERFEIGRIIGVQVDILGYSITSFCKRNTNIWTEASFSNYLR